MVRLTVSRALMALAFGFLSIPTVWAGAPPSFIGLGDLPGGTFDSEALAISADGLVVVGAGNSALGSEAMIWDAANGMRSLQDVLVNDFGLNLNGWLLREATGISADGQTIVGFGVNPSGFTEGWIATIPEPTTVTLLGLGMLLAVPPSRRFFQ